MARIPSANQVKVPPAGPAAPLGGGGGAVTAAVQQKFLTFRQELSDSLIEMDEAVDCLLTGLVNGGNVFLMGPPGTAKSMLAEGVCNWVRGMFFNLLLSPTTIPEELFGPVSLKEMRERDVIRRNVADSVVESHIIFLDEVMKAPSAILSALLKLMNERVYHNGPGNSVACPVRMVVGASNEFAGAGDEAVASFLAPFWDRFLYRMVIPGTLTREGRDRLLFGPEPKIAPSASLSLAELETAQGEAKALPITDEAREAFVRILDELDAKHGIRVSPRRLSKLSHGGVQAYAYLMGDDRVRVEHLEVLQWCLWAEGSTEQMRQVKDVVLPVANPTGAKLTEFRQMVAEEVAKVQKAPRDAKFMLTVAEVLGNLDQIVRKVKALPRHPQTKRLMAYVAANQQAFKNLIVSADTE